MSKRYPLPGAGGGEEGLQLVFGYGAPEDEFGDGEFKHEGVWLAGRLVGLRGVAAGSGLHDRAEKRSANGVGEPLADGGITGEQWHKMRR